MTSESIHVTVKLFATLRKGRFDVNDMELSSGTTVVEVIRQLAIPEHEVTLVFINGRHALFDTVLTSEDVLAFFPPVGGG